MPSSRQLADDAGERFLVERIEAGERFVEHDKRRPVKDGRNKLNFLLVAFRQRVELDVGTILETHAIEPSECGGLCVRRFIPRRTPK